MDRSRLEKEDRAKLKKALQDAGCLYVQTTHGSMFQRDIPDLIGVGDKGIFFAVELKRNSVSDLEKALSEKQHLRLRQIAEAGARTCVAQLLNPNRGQWVVRYRRRNPAVNVFASETTMELPDFCGLILNRRVFISDVGEVEW
jgi:Holliday junction resolvase